MNYIERNNKEIRDDAILTVLYLAENEVRQNLSLIALMLTFLKWYWGEEHRMWAHMKGLKEMLRLRGGIENMTIDLWLRRQIISSVLFKILSTFI